MRPLPVPMLAVALFTCAGTAHADQTVLALGMSDLGTPDAGGDLTRLPDPMFPGADGTATFGWSTFLLGAGEFQLTDADGDVFMGTFAGAWTTAGGFDFFSGHATAWFDSTNGDGVFEGTLGGSFVSLDDTAVLTGAFSMLKPEGQIAPLQVDAVFLVPAPGGTPALVGVLGVLGARRRRPA